MKAIAKEFYARTRKKELENNYLPNLLKYLHKWIIHSSGCACFNTCCLLFTTPTKPLWLSPTICNISRPFVVAPYSLQQLFSPYRIQPSSLLHGHCHLLATIVLW